MDRLLSIFKKIMRGQAPRVEPSEKISTVSAEIAENIIKHIYVPTDEELFILENLILDSAKNKIPNYQSRATYGSYPDDMKSGYNNDTWRYNKNTNKYFPLKFEYAGKEFQWHFEMIADNNLIGVINLINFCHYYIETEDWQCVVRYWECHPGILFEALESRGIARDYIKDKRKFVSFSGNPDIFKNDMVLVKMVSC